MKKNARAVLWLTFAVYCFAVLRLTFFHRPGYTHAELWEHINLIPLRTVFNYVQWTLDGWVTVEITARNLLGNLVLFFPMGCYLPILFPSLQRKETLVWQMFGLLLGIETLQLLLRVGTFDVDDILLNLAGTFAGFALVRVPCVARFLRRVF